MINLIGLAAQKQNGKDTLADYLLDRHLVKWDRRAWADGLKKTVSEVFGVDRYFIEEWKENPEPPPGWSITMRKCLQFVGDGMRQVKGDCWLEYTTRDRQASTIITDGRYLNELAKIKELGGFNLLVYRPGFLNDIDHPSESQLRPVVEFFVERKWHGRVRFKTDQFAQQQAVPEGADYIDYVIWNDGDIIQLRKKVDEFVLSLLFGDQK